MNRSSHPAAFARRALLVGALYLCATLPARAADDLTQWGHSQNLYFDTSPNGANVANAVRDFPVLIRLRSGNFNFAQAMYKGQDIRFAKPNGMPLSYEIERWDSAGAKAEIWVRIDTVPGNYQGVFATMYWGKPGALDRSDPGSVFATAIGFEDVWHMGAKGTANRPNAVNGKQPAVPVDYGTDKSREGAVGMCDSLDGAASGGDYLDIGDGYTEFANSLTISVWAYPTRNSAWGRIVDLGNGAGLDNIYFARRENTQDLTLAFWTAGQKAAEIVAPGVLTLNQWGLYTVTVSGKAAKIYSNGALVASGELASPLNANRRVYNYIGRSNWAADEYWAGKLDELEISNFARSADWIKLAYANQKPSQNLVGFNFPMALSLCVQKFATPADTTLPEGSSLNLVGTADCATGYQWAAIAGPAPRILDPAVKILQVSLPRITQDTSILYRFTANFGASAKTRDVLVRIKEAIPEPAFTLNPFSWNGLDSFYVRPDISNLSDIRNSREPKLNYSWTITNLVADTAWRRDGLLLRSTPAEGTLKVGLCLNNNGPQVCRSATVTVNRTVGLALRDHAGRGAAAALPHRDARGRFARKLRSLPGFPADPAR